MWKRKLEAVKFLWKWKRKHFDEKDWKRKRTRKRLALPRAGSKAEAKNSKGEEAEAN